MEKLMTAQEAQENEARWLSMSYPERWLEFAIGKVSRRISQQSILGMRQRVIVDCDIEHIHHDIIPRLITTLQNFGYHVKNDDNNLTISWEKTS